MTDDELRALVRETVSRQLGARHLGQSVAPPTPVLVLREHPSHYRYALASGDEADGPGACLIEPTVRCNHCGYCQSHGH
jgi:hypothetical protein